MRGKAEVEAELHALNEAERIAAARVARVASAQGQLEAHESDGARFRAMHESVVCRTPEESEAHAKDLELFLERHAKHTEELRAELEAAKLAAE